MHIQDSMYNINSTYMPFLLMFNNKMLNFILIEISNCYKKCKVVNFMLYNVNLWMILLIDHNLVEEHNRLHISIDKKKLK